ncbi:MAG: hydroxysqualene dehydroxylase HpnE [Acidimicrobiales bacterium]
MSSASRHVVVVGGGLAGLSAAIVCADEGARVSVFEARPRLGGATWSFERNGLRFDNGQHVFLRCCTAYRGLLERLGTSSLASLQDRLAVPVLRRQGETGVVRVAQIRRNRLPAPAHLAGSLLRYRHLRFADRLRAMPAALAIRRIDLDDAALDQQTFASYLSEHGQSSEAIARFWDLITLPTVNVRAREASLALAAKVFKTGLFDDTDAADIGWAHVPLEDVHVKPAAEAIAKCGGAVYHRRKVVAIETNVDEEPRQVTGVLTESGRVEADAVIVAVPHRQASELVPKTERFDPAALDGLGSSPIIDVHVVYDRKITELEFAAAVDSPVQFVFDKTVAAGLDPKDGQVIAVSVSGADDEHGERPDVLTERYRRELEALFPKARAAKVLDAVVSREHEATFRGVPGTRQLRAPTEIGLNGCFLAGAWTDTGWPATMEGAVRSGNAAAAAALRYLSLAPRNEPTPTADVFA